MRIFTRARKIRIAAASILAVGSLAIFMLASMAGPNQLDYLGITLGCDVGLLVLAAL